jgi:large conductance mechanosensitive channel
MLKQLRDFLLRGNVVDLAVAVVIGAAFGAVVTSLVADIVTPLIAALFGKPDFGGLTFTIHHSQFRYGSFLNAVISFVLVGTAVFFLVVQPVNYLMERRKRGLEPEATAVPDDVALLAEIRDLLRDQSSATTPSRPT